MSTNYSRCTVRNIFKRNSEEILKINEQGKNYPNLSKEERQALKELIDDKDIIIKPADKGSAIVIWDKEDYLKEYNAQLENSNVYEKYNQFQPKEVNKQIKSVLSKMLLRKEIDKKIMEYLIKKKTQYGRFYLLPKIHKRTFNVPGRPVISNNSTVTENISAFLDFYLKPVAETILHILEDTRKKNKFCKMTAKLSNS